MNNPMHSHPTSYTRRHSRLHERLLLSFLFQLIIGISLLVSLSVIPIWGIRFWEVIDLNSRNTLIAATMAFASASFVLRKMLRYPGSQSVAYVLPITAMAFAFLILFFLVIRLNYSNQVIAISFITTIYRRYKEK